MKKQLHILVLALVAPLLASTPAWAQPRGGAAAGGTISMSVHTHSSEFGGPSGPGTLFDTTPLPFPPSQTSFSYSSIPCERPAPFNDAALVFEPGYPGVASPAAVRHFIQGTLTPTARSTEQGIVSGTISTILCQNRVQQTDRMFFAFRGRYRLASDNQIVLNGTFRLTGGEGRFADMRGAGSLQGEITCLPPILQREGAANCAELGAFSDAILQLVGRFVDPTVPAV